MSTIQKRSSGALSLADTELAIDAFEAGFARFQKNELVFVGATGLNQVTFETLDLVVPNDLRLTLDSATAGDGFDKIWEGAMLVAGTNRAVIAWRQRDA